MSLHDEWGDVPGQMSLFDEAAVHVAHAFQATQPCGVPGCPNTHTDLVVVRDVAPEWPELVDDDGALRFVVCADHADVMRDAIVRDALGLPHEVRVIAL